jgi:hypothetical protein
MPDLHCGICTGGVRLFHDTRYGRPITDWKHTDAPAGTQPHRPVLGRPVDAETLARLHRKPEQPTPQPASKTPPSFLRQRDERCPDCGRSSVAHHEGDCP